MKTLAYLMGYFKVGFEIPPISDEAIAAAQRSEKLNKLVKLLDFGTDALELRRDYKRAKSFGLIGNQEKKADYQPLDMPPAGEPEYEGDPETNFGTDLSQDPKYKKNTKQQARAPVKGTGYE